MGLLFLERALKSKDWTDFDYLKDGSSYQRLAWKALSNLGVMETLKKFTPTITGTYPLDLVVKGSDLDIACYAEDEDFFLREASKYFSHLNSFKINNHQSILGKTHTVSFVYEDVSFELFVESKPVALQNSFVHLIAEAVLLETCGPIATREILRLKQEGLKTEPAFAEFFRIKDDPYEHLYKMGVKILESGWNGLQHWTHYGARIDFAAKDFDRNKNWYTKIRSQMSQFCEELILEMLTKVDQKDVFEVDHVCYRTASLDEYEQFKQNMTSHGYLLGESWVNGRPIASFSLKEPLLICGKWQIGVLEVPAPKPGRSYDSGFEHVEVVLTGSLKDFADKYCHLQLNLDDLEFGKNPEVRLKLQHGLVKFHKFSLERIIAIEIAEIVSREQTAVLFDLDDTLIETGREFIGAMKQALEEILNREVSLEEIQTKARPTFPEFFKEFGLSTSGDLDQAIKIFQVFWLKKSPKMSGIVGIQTLLSTLKSYGFQLGVWTARDELTALNSMKDFFPEGFFDLLETYQGPHLGKPIPSTILRQWIQSKRGYLVGDSESDRDGAGSLGIRFFQAGWIRQKELGIKASDLCLTPLRLLEQILLESSIISKSVRPQPSGELRATEISQS